MKRSRSGKCSYSGSVSFKFNDESYEAEVNAVADYYYQPCVMYFKDGTGQPEDSDFEIDELEIKSLYNEDTDTECMSRFNSDEDFKEQIEDAVREELNGGVEWNYGCEQDEAVDDYLDRLDDEEHFGGRK